MQLDLSKLNLPKLYLRNGKECFLCQVRKKLIVVTEEEKVRQAFIKQLVTDFKFPIEYMDVEVPLSHFKKGLKGRADIVIYKNAIPLIKDREVLLLIECKKPNEVLDIHTHENQIDKYHHFLNADIQVLTNGKQTRLKDRNHKVFQDIQEFPTYTSLLTKQKIKFKAPEPIEGYEKLTYYENGNKRHAECLTNFYGFYKVNIPYEVLTNNQWLDGYFNKVSFDPYPFGKKTPRDLYPYILRLIDLIYNPEIVIKSLSINKIKFVKDLGFRFDKFGYPAGVLIGFYRYFMIKDYGGDTQIISFAIYSNYSKTYIMVGLDDFEKKNHSLELCLDNHIIKDDNSKDFMVVHDGRLTIGVSPQKKSDIISFIKKKAVNLVKNDFVQLGYFNLKDTMGVDNKNDVVEFYCRLIEYSLLRNEFRKIQKGKITSA